MIRIGGASGYWGESAMATPQLLNAGVDVLIYDYLAEITMSLLARAKMKDPSKGYAPDFVSTAMAPHLRTIAERGVKVISNAGGLNPEACGAALRALIKKSELDLTVAVVTGDDLIGQLPAIRDTQPRDLDTNEPLSPAAHVISMNAYLGAFPIARALEQGADIVITGRVVDSALSLGALIHRYDWRADDLDKLAAGSLVGHLLECGPQATGGNFTDWRDVPRREAIGYPIAEVEADGTAVITKPEGSGGLVSRGTVSEQLVYEIGDPSAYQLPDVTCDFRTVTLEDIGNDRVRVTGAKGSTPPPDLKVCATHVAGWRGGHVFSFYGDEANEKSREFARCVFDRSNAALAARNMPPYTDTSVEVLGSGAQFGDDHDADEVVIKIGVRHSDEAGIGILLKEAMGMGLATPPGLCGFAGGRPKPSPVVQLFSFLTPKDSVDQHVIVGEESPRPWAFAPQPTAATVEIADPPKPTDLGDLAEVPLIDVAWARSGDKGNSANVGVIARHPDLLPYLWDQLTEDRVAAQFSHVLEGNVRRFAMPGAAAINFLLTKSLGGGGIASLRNDPQGKGFSQVLLRLPVRVPQTLLNETKA